MKALTEKQIKDWVNKVPLNRLGKKEEIFNAVKMIIENDFFNGKVLEVDGGFKYLKKWIKLLFSALVKLLRLFPHILRSEQFEIIGYTIDSESELKKKNHLEIKMFTIFPI